MIAVERSLKDVKVGDTLLIWQAYYAETAERRKETYMPTKTGTVEKIGRTLLHVKIEGSYSDKITKFAIEDGVESRHRAAIGSPDRAYTPEGWRLHHERRQLERRLGGIMRDAWWYTRLSISQLERILAIVGEAE